MLNLSLVILAGGKGSRIKKITKKIPKPLIKIRNNFFINFLLNFYSKFNFNNIFILTGYKHYHFNRFHGKRNHISFIKCIREKKKLDTAGSLLQLKNRISSNFILINGDSFIEYDVQSFIRMPLNKSIGRMLLIKNNNYKSNKKLSNLKLIKGKVSQRGHLMNAGVYKFKKEILNSIPKASSLENDILPKFIDNKKILGSISSKKFIDIGTYKNLKNANKFFKIQENISAIFLDRDGVINFDKNYVHKIKDFKLKKGVLDAIKYLNKKKIKVFIVTNQAGIGKKLYSEQTYLKFHDKIIDYFRLRKVYIDDMQYSPFHIKSKILKYKKKSSFRKPGNLMIETLIKKWKVDKNKSFMIGDSKKDFLASKKSKLYFEYAHNNLASQVKNIIKKKFNNYL